MAEAAGLAIGTVALIGTFKDCIDVYGMIVSARSLTDDAEVLNTKLDVERMLLLQWADRIGMTEPNDYDRRLDDPDLNRTIARVLESIKTLLSDGKALRDRYGLVDYKEMRHEIAFNDRLDVTAGSMRLQKFIERFNKLSIQTGEPRRDHSVSTRFKWVVKDKEKFASLMDQLSYFVSRLNALVPAKEHATRTMAEEDLAQIRSILQLKLVVKASIGFQPQIALVAQQAIRSLNQERVLDRLWFRWIDDRKTNISDKHSRTLRWALKTTEPTSKWDNLAEWLRSGSGIYWVAGKAGSGKSTLMKHLSEHARAFTLLKEWAGQSELIMLQFFFYALGQPEQKSQEGILRSLLYQSLDKHRDLIEHVLPAMWKEAIITENGDSELAMPSISEMQTALLQLAGTDTASRKLWILIDGLDEFDGKHATIADFILKLGQLPNVKILASGRPLPAFVSRFEHAPKMYLQDLTAQDIEAYINDTITHHPYMAYMAKSEPEMAMKITRIMVKKASGVFLWVVLACRSVLEGLDDHETVSELVNRTAEMPPELGDFFRQIITRVDPRKRDQCARLLRLVFESQKGSEVRSSSLDPLPAIGLAFIDEQGLRADYMGPSVTSLNREQIVLRCQMLEGRLRSRCSGLVELQADRGRAVNNSCVSFMHKSLYEFLCTEGIWEWDVLHVDNGCGRFEPHAILASLWTQLASFRPSDTFIRDARELRDTYLLNALLQTQLAKEANCPPDLFATNFSRLQVVYAELHEAFDSFGGCLPHRSDCRQGYEDLSFGLSLAADLGMFSLVKFGLEDPDEFRRTLIPPEAQHLQDCSSFSTCPSRLYQLNRDRAGSKHTGLSTVFPLLYHATCRPATRNVCDSIYRDRGHFDWESGETVKYLLGNGHDPNEKFFARTTITGVLLTTPWIKWLEFIRHRCPDRHDEADIKNTHDEAAITLLLVDAGAELGAPGTEMHDVVDESLFQRIFNAARLSGRKSVDLARSDDLWLKVRDRISSLRAAASHRTLFVTSAY